MKNLIHILTGSLLLLAAGCDSDDDRTPGPEDNPNSMQVYFSGSNVYDNYFLIKTTEFDLEVNRENTAAAATVPITVIAKDDIFHIPASVSFAAGQATAPLHITFPDVEAYKTYAFSLAIEGSEYVDNYSQLDGGSYLYHGTVTVDNWTAYDATFTLTADAAANPALKSFPGQLLYNPDLDQYRIPDYLNSGANLNFTVNEDTSLTFSGGYKTATGTTWWFYSAAVNSSAYYIPCYLEQEDGSTFNITTLGIYDSGTTYTYLKTDTRTARLYNRFYWNGTSSNGWYKIDIGWQDTN